MITVFAIAPGMMLGMAALLLVTISLIQMAIRPFLAKAGKINQKAYAGMNQWLLQSIQGIKEVKLMQCEGYFEKSFEKEGRVYVRTTYQNQTLSLIPRFMIEAVAMCIFFIMVSVMIYRGMDLEKIIPIIAGVGMAAVRLLPSVNRISGSMAGITFWEPTVDKMIENLQEAVVFDKEQSSKASILKESGEVQELSGKIELSNITYQYPTGKEKILDGASMEIPKGMSIGIVGASGAGKTTAVDILLGLLKPEKGKILVNGTDIQIDLDGWHSEIGYIPQSIFMLDGSIRENVAFGILENEINDEMVWAALKEAALDEFVKTLPEGLYTQIGERGVRLSGGQRQRIGIARALYSDPSILFFDEATSSLDSDTEAAIMDSINHLHGTKTMVIIAHRLTTIEGCDMVYRVEGGQIKRER